jgi:NarL family two-component system response regulator LiaR
MRLGLKGLLLATEMSVVGEAEDGEGAVGLAEALRPDLVVLGLNLAGEPDGIEVCRELKVLPLPPRVLVHTAYNFADDVASCLLAGADGFVHKSVGHGRLLEAMRRVAAGARVWMPGERVGEPRSRIDAAPGGVELTPKEREILAQLVRGHPNAEIARRLYLSLPTVKTHVRSILRKFGARSREDLLRPVGPEGSEL